MASNPICSHFCIFQADGLMSCDHFCSRSNAAQERRARSQLICRYKWVFAWDIRVRYKGGIVVTKHSSWNLRTLNLSMVPRDTFDFDTLMDENDKQRTHELQSHAILIPDVSTAVTQLMHFKCYVWMFIFHRKDKGPSMFTSYNEQPISFCMHKMVRIPKVKTVMMVWQILSLLEQL